MAAASQSSPLKRKQLLFITFAARLALLVQFVKRYGAGNLLKLTAKQESVGSVTIFWLLSLDCNVSIFPKDRSDQGQTPHGTRDQ